MFYIGNVKIENPYILAPMAGFTDLAFRSICKSFGTSLVFTEMVSDKGILYEGEKTLDLIKISDEERPVAVQIFGSDKESLTEAALKICELVKPDLININMGCPVTKVAVKSKAGSYLLKDKEKIREIVKSVSAAIPVPLTVKIRLGWSNKNDALEIAKIIEEAGAKALFVHGRTREEFYQGEADWEIIKKIKKNINIPVIGNGDINSPEDAIKKLKETGVDAVMIGRKALNYPFIFKECLELEKTGSYEKASKKDIINLIIKHINLELKYKDEKLVNLEMRTKVHYYLKGLSNTKDLKQRVITSKSIYDIIDMLENYKEIL